MKLNFRQTKFAWIAAQPEDDDQRGEPIRGQVDHDVQELCVRLLGLAGARVCVPFGEERLCEFIRAHGVLADPAGTYLVEGNRSDCHTNCADLWKHGQGIFEIVTGYGLSDDGMWRRHTWLVDKENNLIETTIPRLKYFGVTLETKRAEAFHEAYGEN